MTTQPLQATQPIDNSNKTLPWITLRDRLVAEAGDSISQIILFGSQARKNARNDSDVDLLVVVKERTSSIVEILRSIRYEVMTQYGFEPLLSLMIVSEEEWKKLPLQSAGLVVNIKKEGIALWRVTPAKTFLTICR